jgi:hypothetical protein
VAEERKAAHRLGSTDLAGCAQCPWRGQVGK